MANKPVPTNLKILRGNPGHNKLPENEPKPEVVCPKPPDILSDIAKKHWKQTVKFLYSAKLMTNMDIDALTIYCEAYARWSEANEHIKENGTIVFDDESDTLFSYKTNPYMMVQQKAFDQMKAMLIEFGMTPSARTRVRTVDKASKTDGWDDA